MKDAVAAGDRVAIGLSGGIDSVVLLDLMARLAGKMRVRLSAVHVNHRLSPNAPRWVSFCRALCRARGIPVRVARVTVPRGDSIEAAARAARHEVFRGLAVDYIVLGHNQDDQVETLFLQLLRGAGVRGLAAMPFLASIPTGVHPSTPHAFRSARSANAPVVLRPLLEVPRSEIERYARRRKLEWVEDESNAQTYFLRNFLRHEVLPLIGTRYPAWRATLARSARNFADAAELLDALAAQDAGQALEEGTLAVATLRRLPPSRARNLLRYFLAGHGLAMPGAERLAEALRQATQSREDARIAIDLDGAQLRRYRGRLYVQRPVPPAPAHFARTWRGEKELALPELGGLLALERGRSAGISLARLRDRAVTIGVRKGGERLQPDCRRPRRTLKNLLQEAALPPWRRERIPLIYCDEELVWAAGIGIDCAYQAQPDEPALRPRWLPRA